MVTEKVTTALRDKQRHRFFLFHPDNKWDSKFNDLVAAKRLNHRFCAYAHDLDTIFVFMKVARTVSQQHNPLRRDERPIKFHLLIPATKANNVSIDEAVRIPEVEHIGDFIMQGGEKQFILLNLPMRQEVLTECIEILRPFWAWFKVLFNFEQTYRELGTSG